MLIITVFLWFTIILHDDTFAFFSPRIVLFIRRINQWIIFLILLNKRSHSVDKTKTHQMELVKVNKYNY